jgi:glutamate formiminotransferase
VNEEAGRLGARVTGAEIVGLAPQAALDDFPADVPLNGFDPGQHVLERRMRLREPIL